jgi:hypothetical protein
MGFTYILLRAGMVNFRNMSSKLLVNSFLKRLLVIIGCLSFLFSFIFPFYSAGFASTDPVLAWSTYYWSYNVEYHYVPVSYITHYSFYDYWFSSIAYIGLGIPWILISLFTVQVLTLIFGAAFIISNRRILSFEPIMFSIAVAALMTYTAWAISGEERLSFQFQLGYYLVFPSIAMFLFAFLLNEVTKKRDKQQAETPASQLLNLHSNRRQTRGS